MIVVCYVLIERCLYDCYSIFFRLAQVWGIRGIQSEGEVE